MTKSYTEIINNKLIELTKEYNELLEIMLNNPYNENRYKTTYTTLKSKIDILKEIKEEFKND